MARATSLNAQAAEKGGEENQGKKMSFIQREIDKIRSKLIETNDQHHSELYAAQQALAWALEPDGIRSPYKMIMGTQEGSEDCQPSSDPQPS
jgi:hypothetical protein